MCVCVRAWWLALAFSLAYTMAGVTYQTGQKQHILPLSSFLRPPAVTRVPSGPSRPRPQSTVACGRCVPRLCCENRC